MDVGGGLGIDYDGSQTDFESSVNYTLQEYANDVVYHIQNVCDEAEVPHPTIMTESGRAVAAYHSVLLFNVLGISEFGEQNVPQELPEDSEQPLVDLQETYKSLSSKNLLESFHDAQQALDAALNLFSLGYLPLLQRSLAENFYWTICRRIHVWPANSTISRKSWKGWKACSRTRTFAISLYSKACPIAGP